MLYTQNLTLKYYYHVWVYLPDILFVIGGGTGGGGGRTCDKPESSSEFPLTMVVTVGITATPPVGA